MGDLNVFMDDKFMISLQTECSYLIVNSTYITQKLNNPKHIDLILTKKPSYFQYSNVFEIALSDFFVVDSNRI